MPSKRELSLFGASVFVLLLFFCTFYERESWPKFVSQVGFYGSSKTNSTISIEVGNDTISQPNATVTAVNPGSSQQQDEAKTGSISSSSGEDAASSIVPIPEASEPAPAASGSLESEIHKEMKSALPPAAGYNKTVVIARTKSEDISWIEEEFGPDPEFRQAFYVADDPEAPLHVPLNKGHEVMIYLTYIIDNYDDLTDINLFMHAHRYTWHNDDLLKQDAARIIRQVSQKRIMREGYMNLRCGWRPGCPEWMHPTNEKRPKAEEKNLAKSWPELFPDVPTPDTLAQPCCGQFAVSRDRLRSIPREQYLYYRDWLMNTKLIDYYSGRVWEYLWQYVFTGEQVFCPVERTCFCDGYGICFGGEEPYKAMKDAQQERRKLAVKLEDWNEGQEWEKSHPSKKPGGLKQVDLQAGKIIEAKIRELDDWIEATMREAYARGEKEEDRALELDLK